MRFSSVCRTAAVKPERGCLVATLKKYKEVLSGIVFLLLCVAVYHSSGSIRVFAPNSGSYINAQFFPKLISAALGIVSVFQIVSGIRSVHAAAPSEEGVSSGGMSRGGMLRIVATLVLLALYVALMKDVGFLIMTALYIFVQALILTPGDRVRLPFITGLAVISSSLIYFLFVNVLSMMLPRAPFLPF